LDSFTIPKRRRCIGKDHLEETTYRQDTTRKMLLQSLIGALLVFILPVSAQFQFFDQMFNRQQPQQPQNAGSDSAWYQQRYEDGETFPVTINLVPQSLTRISAHCDKYLCPHTLSCVHFPHHCPCAFPEVEDKIEFGDGSMACVSKGGFKAGEAARKVELARKGLL
jgi:hypothetical protein